MMTMYRAKLVTVTGQVLLFGQAIATRSYNPGKRGPVNSVGRDPSFGDWSAHFNGSYRENDEWPHC